MERQILTRVADLAAIREAWIALWDRCPTATPFQRPEWLLAWCRRFAQPEVHVVVVRAGARVVGLVPLQRYEGTLRLLGEGITDYLDTLVDPEHEAAVLGALATEMATWDRAELTALPSSSPLLRVALPSGMRDEAAPDDVCPVLSLECGLEAALPKEMARNLRRARAKAEERGRLSFTIADEARRAALLEALFALHGARWGNGGVLGDEAVRAIHREASEGFCAAGMLRLAAVAIDETVVGVVYGFAAKGVWTLYLQGYDPALAEVSPGTLVVGLAVEQAAREGAQAVDMLRGREGYKYRFGAKDRGTWRRVIAR